MDVDGTLTDGKVYMGNDGEIAKAFDIKDGAGILLTLPKENITPIIITARESRMLENRCKELNIKSLHQNVKDKLKKLMSVVGDAEGLGTVAYAGDDIPDIPCMEAVKNAGGVVLAPANAIPEIKALADYISGRDAGDGAIRDCINFLVQYNLTKACIDRNIKKRVQKAVEQILSTDFNSLDDGIHSLPDGTQYNLQVYHTKAEEDCVLESHRNHIDIQFMVDGSERFKMYSTNCLTKASAYNEEKDIEYWNGGLDATESILVPGSLIIVYNGQPHKGAIRLAESVRVRKVVCKIEV